MTDRVTERTRRPAATQMLVPFDLTQRAARVARPEEKAFACITECFTESTVDFQPLGLFLTGVTDATRVHELKIGNTIQLQPTYRDAPLPGRFFETTRSFEQLQQLADRGELDDASKLGRFVMSEAAAGTHHRLTLSGPVETATLWGLVQDRRVPLRVTLQAVTSELGAKTYRGELTRETLLGDELVASVTGETEAGAIALLKAAGDVAFRMPRY